MLLHAYSAIVLLLVSTNPQTLGAVFTPQQEDNVIKFVTSLLQCNKIVGMTLAVARENETWTRGFGLADRERGTNVSTDHLFGIASLSKAFTAALISLFINNTGTDRYSWHTPIADILGKKFRFVTDELTRKVTLKDILTHRTGLASTNIPAFAGSNLTAAAFARKIRHLHVKKPFRDGFYYSNDLYALAGYVTRKMSGDLTWEEALERHLLQPLNMTASGVLGQTVSVSDVRMAKPYVILDNDIILHEPTVYRISPREAAAGIASSAKDMGKWLLMLINIGRTSNGTQLLAESRLREMISPHTAMLSGFRNRFNLVQPNFPVLFATDAYGLGWFTANYRGYPFVWHSGSLHAYTSFMALIPKQKMGVFISTNGPYGWSTYYALQEVFFYVADTVLETSPWLNIVNSCLYPGLWQEIYPKDKPAMVPVCKDYDFNNSKLYLGRYKHHLYGDVNIVKNGSKGLYAHYGFLEGRLCMNIEKKVVEWEVAGPMRYLYQYHFDYLQLTFSHPSHNGTFLEVVLSHGLFVLESERLVFQRRH